MAIGFELARVDARLEDLATRQNGMHSPILSALDVVVGMLLLLGVFAAVRWVGGWRRESALDDAANLDPRLAEEWFSELAPRQTPPVPPMIPQSDADHFRSAHEALEQNLPVPLPPPRVCERDDW